MTIESILRLHDAQPFQPFVLHRADGGAIPVRHREFMASAPSGHSLFVFRPDDSFNIIDLLLVTDAEVTPNAPRKPRRRPS
jgi:hypothetical protein